MPEEVSASSPCRSRFGFALDEDQEDEAGFGLPEEADADAESSELQSSGEVELGTCMLSSLD